MQYKKFLTKRIFFSFLALLLIVIIVLVTIGTIFIWKSASEYYKKISETVPVNNYVLSSADSPDGAYKATIKITGEIFTHTHTSVGNDQLQQALLLTPKDPSLPQKILLIEKGPNNNWLSLRKNNWSPNNQYFYLPFERLVPVKSPWGGDMFSHDAYIFRVDDHLFHNGKNYLVASEMGYNATAILKIQWISNAELQMEGMPHTKLQGDTYTLDVEKEIAKKSK